MGHFILMNVMMIVIITYYALIFVDAKTAKEGKEADADSNKTKGAGDKKSNKSRKHDDDSSEEDGEFPGLEDIKIGKWSVFGKKKNSGIALEVSPHFLYATLLISTILMLREFEM